MVACLVLQVKQPGRIEQHGTACVARVPQAKEGPMPPRYELLVNEDDLYCCPDQDLDVTRMVESFRHAWKRIPVEARKTILTHWRPQGRLLPKIAQMIPMIRFTSEDYSEWGCVVAWCSPPEVSDYKFLGFYIPVLEQMPDEDFITTIPHELCHVYIRSIGKHNPSYDRSLGSSDPEEQAADMTITDWGFDAAALRSWCAIYKFILDALQGGS